MLLRDVQCKANGEGRKEVVAIAMAVVLYMLFTRFHAGQIEDMRAHVGQTCHSAGPVVPQNRVTAVQGCVFFARR
jgi:hypothetical protein